MFHDCRISLEYISLAIFLENIVKERKAQKEGWEVRKEGGRISGIIEAVDYSEEGCRLWGSS